LADGLDDDLAPRALLLFGQLLDLAKNVVRNRDGIFIPLV
jgi:hypothetical protein